LSEKIHGGVSHKAAFDFIVPMEHLVAALEYECTAGNKVLTCDRALFAFVNRCLNLFEHECNIVSADKATIQVTVTKIQRPTR
jgi:hypothetical protein